MTVGTPIGIIALSYGRREVEPSPCNRRLANEVRRIRAELAAEGHEVFIGAQWEVALGLNYYDWCVMPDLKGYQSSKDVVDEVQSKLFVPKGVTTVVAVTQPFLQSVIVRRHLEQAGLTVMKRHVGPIGHDKQSLQPWTRSAEALMIYASRQLLTHHNGKLIVTDQMRELVKSGLPPRSKS